jgi:hypothetical protein
MGSAIKIKPSVRRSIGCSSGVHARINKAVAVGLCFAMP